MLLSALYFALNSALVAFPYHKESPVTFFFRSMVVFLTLLFFFSRMSVMCFSDLERSQDRLPVTDLPGLNLAQ